MTNGFGLLPDFPSPSHIFMIIIIIICRASPGILICTLQIRIEWINESKSIAVGSQSYVMYVHSPSDWMIHSTKIVDFFQVTDVTETTDRRLPAFCTETPRGSWVSGYALLVPYFTTLTCWMFVVDRSVYWYCTRYRLMGWWCNFWLRAILTRVKPWRRTTSTQPIQRNKRSSSVFFRHTNSSNIYHQTKIE